MQQLSRAANMTSGSRLRMCAFSCATTARNFSTDQLFQVDGRMIRGEITPTVIGMVTNGDSKRFGSPASVAGIRVQTIRLVPSQPNTNLASNAKTPTKYPTKIISGSKLWPAAMGSGDVTVSATALGG